MEYLQIIKIKIMNIKTLKRIGVKAQFIAHACEIAIEDADAKDALELRILDYLEEIEALTLEN